MDQTLEGWWQCKDCQFSSKIKERTLDHVKDKHLETGGFKCEFCSKFWPNISGLRRHVDTYHKSHMLLDLVSNFKEPCHSSDKVSSVFSKGGYQAFLGD